MKLHSNELLYGLSEFYKIFGDQTRLKILDALTNKPLCVNDLNYQAISNLKEKPEELINDLNNYIMCSKLFFFAILLETLAVSLILLGF